MTTFIKAKLMKSDDQTKIYKYRVVANITKYHIISKLKINLPKDHHSKLNDDKSVAIGHCLVS